jgi:hypothetical protein
VGFENGCTFAETIKMYQDEKDYFIVFSDGTLLS